MKRRLASLSIKVGCAIVGTAKTTEVAIAQSSARMNTTLGGPWQVDETFGAPAASDPATAVTN